MTKATTIALTVFSVISLISCKKNRTCTCKVTEQNGSTTELTYTYKSLSKSTAKSNCFDYDITDQTTNKTTKYDCSLKLQIMKKRYIYLWLPFFLFWFSSCKKDYTCTCVVTQYGQAGSINIGSATTTLKINMKSVSKKTAKRNCISGKIQQSTSQDYILNDCKLN